MKETLPSKIRSQELKRGEILEENSSAAISEHESGINTPTLQHRLSEGDLHEANTLRRANAKALAKRIREQMQDQEREVESAAEPERASIRSLLTPQIISVLTSQMMNNLINITYTAVIALFLYSDTANGGLNFTKSQIGYILGLNGVSGLIVQLIIFPRLEKYLGGPLMVYRKVLMFLPLTFSCFPLAHWVRVNFPERPSLTWTVLVFQVAFKSIGNMGLVCATLLV